VTPGGAAPAGESFVLVAGLSAADVVADSLMQGKHPNGTALCVGRHEGALFAVKDSCPHAEFPLSEGTLYANGELECCWHGARFDCQTGAVLRGPAEDPLVRYEVEERDGGIWVRRAR
jgi:nitrite reductase/ring-hydroxylating ferredoxin subunit